jgi:predicted N-formylglutamate amidohydrolase
MNAILVTCEHGGNRVPREYAERFRGKGRILECHRGYDRGARELAKQFARRFDCPLVTATVTRLVADLNRSLGHRRLFSEFTEGLDAEAKAVLLRRYYEPYRRRVASIVKDLVDCGGSVLHLSVHSFTPSLGGVVRTADVGLLYDPARRKERVLCERWRDVLRQRRPELRIRRNYPYLGVSDSLVTWLRRRFRPGQYAAVELEVNQKFPDGPGPAWQRLRGDLVETLGQVI